MSKVSHRETFVLIPGAWMGAWCWYPVARLLREGGYSVVALTLPGLSYGSDPAELSMADAVDFIVSEVEARNLHDVVLVSHSWGGYPATAAAHRLASRIAQVVYYAAVVPERGTSMSDENELYAQVIHQMIADTPDGTVPLTLEAVQQGLMPNESFDLQQLVFSMTLPQPGRYMTDPLDVGPVTDIGLPAAYILGTEDRSLARPGAEFAARLNLQPIIVPGDHMALLTDPAAAADALITLVSTTA